MNQQTQILLVWKRDTPQCTLSPHSRVSICLWSSGASDRWILLSCHALLQYGVHGYVFAGIVGSVPWRYRDALLWRSRMAQSQIPGAPGKYRLVYISPYTPEMNPIRQIWKGIRKRGFRNEAFVTLDKVLACLCDIISFLPPGIISHITKRDWITEVF